jgi:hypothetical protein
MTAAHSAQLQIDQFGVQGFVKKPFELDDRLEITQRLLSLSSA